MIKRLLCISFLLSFLSGSLFAQENLLDRILAANIHSTLKAGFVQIRLYILILGAAYYGMSSVF